MWMKTKIKISRRYSQEEREAIAFDVLDHILSRTERGIDKNGSKFPSYSKAYKDSLDFKIAGKSNKVDLKLSGDMLADMKLLDEEKGAIVIGYENDTESNAKAEGNIKGTYGQKKSTGKRRDFLGIEEKELAKILAKYPLSDEEKRKERVSNIASLLDKADEISGRIILNELEE